MRLIAIVRTVVAAMVLSGSTLGQSFAADLRCTPIGPSIQDITYSPLNPVNRDMVNGTRLSPIVDNLSASVTCTGGVAGKTVELEVSSAPERNPRPNPYGSGLLVDSDIAGVGYVLEEVAPNPGGTVVRSIVRNSLESQLLGSGRVGRVYMIKTGPIDMSRDHTVQLDEYVRFRARERTQDYSDTGAWHVVRAYRSIVRSSENLNVETCYFGDAPFGPPVVRAHALPAVATTQLRGVGTESTTFIHDNTLRMNCRYFYGGHLFIESAYARQDMDGVLDSRAGDGMAAGVGFRIRDGVAGQPWRLNERRVLPSANGADLLQFLSYSVRYVQIAPRVTPGRVESMLTLTFEYN